MIGFALISLFNRTHSQQLVQHTPYFRIEAAKNGKFLVLASDLDDVVVLSDIRVSMGGSCQIKMTNKKSPFYGP